MQSPKVKEYFKKSKYVNTHTYYETCVSLKATREKGFIFQDILQEDGG